MAPPKLPLWHAYVDECGDRGWKLRPEKPTPATNRGASGIFAATAVLVPDGSQSGILTAWEAAGVDVGRPPGKPIHWVNVRGHSSRRHLAQTLGSRNDLKVISVVLCKRHMVNADGLRDAERLYNWTLRLLVERISWFAKDRGVEMALTFAQIKGITPAIINAYLTLLQGRTTSIEWGHIRLPVKIDTPVNRAMLQLADTASGAIFQAFEPDEFGLTEQSYLTDLKPVIWRRYPRQPLVGRGLKLFPWPNPLEEAHVPWFGAFCDP